MKCGIVNSCINFSSISKILGEEISSKLIPAKVGEINSTVFTISSGSFVSRQIGKASTPPNSLKIIYFASITGIVAYVQISPKPNTDVPSVTIATVWPFIVNLKTLYLSSAFFRQGSAILGVYEIDKSTWSSIDTFDSITILPLFNFREF